MTQNDWFQRWFATADLLCLLEGRGWFTGKASPTFGTMLGVWNPTDELEEALEHFGTVLLPTSNKTNAELTAYS